MKYAIVFSSRTGNTAQLAKVIQEILPKKDCVYVGQPHESALLAPLIFVGFWTDRGTCDQTTLEFLKMMSNHKLFLFGTAGFGENPAYFKKILDTVKTNLRANVAVIGDFMCQGKMPESVLLRYEKSLTDCLQHSKTQEMMDNFHKAKSHPDDLDEEELKRVIINLNQIGGTTL